MKYLTQPYRFFRHLPTLPFIFLAVIPIFILDVWVELYQRVSFPFYRIPYIKRRDYIKIDRQRLSYLGPFQKLNCMYCGYANGVVKYWTKVFAETEHYWCGIQHEQQDHFMEPEHHINFIPYNDKEAYNEVYYKNRTRGL